MEKKEKGRDSIWGFLACLLVVFIFSGLSLTIQQNELNNVSSDANDIEYISSSTQRLVRLIVSGQSDQKLFSYLEQQNNLLLDSTNSTAISVLSDPYFDDLAKEVLYYWDNIIQLITVENIDQNTLLLAADNHFYHMTNMSDLINKKISVLSENIAKTQAFISVLILIFSIVIINNVLSYRNELKEKKEQAKLALIDTATGLFNRSKCQEIFKASSDLSNEKHSAMIVFDLNDLKKANDVYGHRVGDELIKTFANLLKATSEVHRIPPFMGRYGGDEFIVYYEDINNEDELKLFLKELAFLTKDANSKEKRFQVSYAHGYAITSNSGTDSLNVRQLFDLADASMYENKKEIKSNKTDKTDENTITEFVQKEDEFEDMVDDEHIIIDYEKNEKDRIKADKTKSTNMIACVLVAVVLFNVISTANTQSNLDYIGGNVFHLPIGDGSTKLDEQFLGNPWNNSSLASLLTFRGLFLPNSDFTDVTADLAAKYEILDDGLTYKITLKEGEKWSDGTLITTDDILFSFESFLLCGNGNVNLSTAFNKIEGAEEFRAGKIDTLTGLEVDGNVITINLTKQHNTFIQMLAEFVPLPKHILSEIDVTTITSNIDYFKNPVCSGMYMVDGMNSDYDLVLVKNPYYSDTASDIEKIVLHWDYLNEEIDYYSTSNISQMVSYRTMRGFDEYNVDVYFYRYFVFNLAADYDVKTIEELEEATEIAQDEEVVLKEYGDDRGENTAIQDVRVRQAIIHAIDCDQLLSDLYFNTGSLTYSGAAAILNNPVYEYNPNKARELLKEAEYDFDRVFTIAYYHSDATTYIFLQQVKEYLEAVGLTVDIVKSSGTESMYKTREYDMLLKGLSSYNTDDWYSEFLSTNGNMSALMGDKGEFDELVSKLSITSDIDSYNDILQELVLLEQSLVYKIPLFTLNETIYVNDNRVQIPEDILFTNTRYRSDLRFDEWSVKKG